MRSAFAERIGKQAIVVKSAPMVEARAPAESGTGRLTALMVYIFISLALFGIPVIFDPGRLHIGYFNDPAMMMWYLEWWPHAIASHLNPFITHAIWPQTGYNLTWATSMPAVAVAMAPITTTFGPVAGYNIASLIAPALSAWTAFLLCRHFTRDFVSAFVGGCIYGFSPYEVAHVVGGHPVLTFNLVPPLCVLLVILLIENRLGARRFILVLASLVALQCLISTEILATMTLFGGAAILSGVIMVREARSRLMAAAIPIGLAYIIAALLLAPFWYYAFIKGSAPGEPVFPARLFSADLLSFVVPGQFILVQPSGAKAVYSRFAGNLWENGSYMGIPLLMVAVIWLRQHRAEARARLLGVLLLIVSIAALGPVLQIERHPIVMLPWAMAARLPLLRHALPLRFAPYAFLILSIIFSCWLAEPDFAFKRVLVGATVVALLPVPTFFLARSTYDTPAFFSSGLYRDYLRPNENVLIIPFGRSGPSMAWQAESSMYFRMPGGHLSTTPEDFRRWPIVNALVNSLPLPDPGRQLRAFAAAYGIDAIIVVDNARGAARDLPAALGIKPLKVGGVSLYRLHGHEAEPTIAELEGFQVDTAQEWFQYMLCAGQRFIADGGDLASLDPRKAYGLGLLQYSDWSSDLDFLLAGLPHTAYNGLWVGPGGGGTIAVGVPASGIAAHAVAAKYGSDAASILYPYPQPYTDTVARDDKMRFLLMNLRPAAFQHCAPNSANWSSTTVR
jgi:hypothetical protein